MFLYHGTNCYRRWEITRTGYFQPGRNEYSFFCTNAADAYTYARAACMRDIGPDAFNSLICEPIVLKVKFTARTWLQVDFIQVLSTSAENDSPTYSVAVLAREHRIPFYVCAPLSTVDANLADGSQIPIEERDPREVTEGFGVRTAPEGVAVYNPAFDVTPARLVTAIVTEVGLIERPNTEGVAAALARGRRKA